jgi:predicted amidophosphoribosyltransferase
MPGAIACRGCTKPLPDGARFCPACGAEGPGFHCPRCGHVGLSETCARCGGSEKNAAPSCARCGEALAADHAFCKRCGAKKDAPLDSGRDGLARDGSSAGSPTTEKPASAPR